MYCTFFEKVVMTDLFENGCWFEYHNEFFQASKTNKIDVLYLKYEDMKKDDGVAAVKQIADFMGIEGGLYDAETIAAACSFSKMRKVQLMF